MEIEQAGLSDATGGGGGTLIFRARGLASMLAVAVTVLVAMCLLAIFDQFTGIPVVVQWLLSVLVLVLAGWRVSRTGVKVSASGLTFRNVFRDVQVPWGSIHDIRLVDSSGVLGRTDLPCVETLDGEREAIWLAGYAFRNKNRRVVRQTEEIRKYWLAQRD